MSRIGGPTRDAEIDADLRLAVAELEASRTALCDARAIEDDRQRAEAVAAVTGKLELAQRALSAAIRRLKPRDMCADLFKSLRPLLETEGRERDAMMAKLSPRARKRVAASIAAMNRAEARERDDD